MPYGKRTGTKTPNLFKEYEANSQSRTQQRRQQMIDEEREADPTCFCCKSTMVLIVCNSATFILSLGLVIVGAFVNNEVQGWELRLFDIIGNLCLALGVFVAFISIVGIMAGRTASRVLLFIYFMCVMLVTYLLALAVTWAALEQDKIKPMMDDNWDTIQEVLGTEVTKEDAEELLEDYMIAICSVGVIGLATLLFALVSTIRLLGIKSIAYSSLFCLGCLGAGAIYAGAATRKSVPTLTTWLLWACGGVQILCAGCGLAGFKNLNKECMRWFFLVLTGATGGLGYVVVSTYIYLRDNPTETPEHLMIVFGIAIISDFFMVSTGLFGAIYYCKTRGAFAAAKEAALPVTHFSDNARKFGKKGPRGRARSEYLSRNAL